MPFRDPRCASTPPSTRNNSQWSVHAWRGYPGPLSDAHPRDTSTGSPGLLLVLSTLTTPVVDGSWLLLRNASPASARQPPASLDRAWRGCQTVGRPRQAPCLKKMQVALGSLCLTIKHAPLAHVPRRPTHPLNGQPAPDLNQHTNHCGKQCGKQPWKQASQGTDSHGRE
jgi:hypothetical protein